MLQKMYGSNSIYGQDNIRISISVYDIQCYVYTFYVSIKIQQCCAL